MITRDITQSQHRAIDNLLSDIWRWTGAIVRHDDLIVEDQGDESIRVAWIVSDHLAVAHIQADGSGTSGWGKVELVHHSGYDACDCNECRSTGPIPRVQ